MNSNFKKSVGIVTFHRSDNCGSILQAYALQHTLKMKLNIDNELINFSNREQRILYSNLFWPKTLKQVVRNILNFLFIIPLKRHRNDYLLFRNNFLVTDNCDFLTSDNMINLHEKYNCIISGSDQIWNLNAADCDDVYFINFTDKVKKIAYAVSLGATNPNTLDNVKKEKYKLLINNFNAISVRENNAKLWIGELVDKKIELCLDPTLLLNTTDWLHLEGRNEIKGPYIFWYTKIYKRELVDTIQYISKKLKMPIYVLDAKEWSRRALFIKGIKLTRHGGPSAFLTLIKKANIVITSSFHGTIFSTIYKKNFWYINVNPNRKNDDRASSLLSQLGLLDRFVTQEEFLNKEILNEPNFTHWNNIKQEYINHSINFLTKNIKLREEL